MAYEEQLGKVWIFSQLEQDDLARIAKAVVPRSYKAGQEIVKEGDQAVAFYVITSGRVELTKDAKPIGSMGPGDSFGEMSLLDGYPRSASLTATEDTECLVMTRWDFTAELRTSPKIALAILPELSKRVRRLQGEDIPFA